MNAISAEVKEKSSKEKIIVIFGLKESTKNTKEEKEKKDIFKIQEIFTELNLNNIKVQKHYRIKSSKPDANKPSI